MQRYAERVDELLSDGYLIGDQSSDVRLTSKGVAKLHDLIDDGFLIMARREDNVRLTYKGVTVLMACADRPIKPRREIRRVPVQRRKQGE